MAQVYKSAGTEAARVACEDPEMDRVADRMAALIRTTAAEHRKTGTYDASVTVERVRGKRGVTDRMVAVTDPAAEHIEWGHLTDAGENGQARWVPGLRIVTRAFEAMH